MSAIFDALAPWDPGVLLVEASAGTGKTYSITSLYLRLVMEFGHLPEHILVVTFTKDAAAELKSRIRQRLVTAWQQGALALEGEPPQDAVVAAVLGTQDEDGWEPLARDVLTTRLKSLRRALVEFDAAPISTMHAFCQDALGSFGFEGGQALDLDFVEDVRPLLEELVDDHLTRGFSEGVSTPPLARDVLFNLARAVTSHPDAPCLPERLVEAKEWEDACTAFSAAWTASHRAKLAQELKDAQAAGAFKPGQKTWGCTKAGELMAPTQKRLEEVDAALAARDAGLLCACKLLAEGPDAAAAENGQVFSSTVLAALQGLSGLAVDHLNLPAARFTAWVRAEFTRRKEARRVQTFDDLLHHVRDALRHDTGKNGIKDRLRRAYKAALIDEFQDTDPVQWEIFGSVFRNTGTHRLVLVGDPKQAIYSFRGADVFVYRAALHETPAESHRSMRINHRSDGRLLHGLNTLMGGRGPVFDVEGIEYVEVEHARGRNPWDALKQGGENQPPLVVRWFDNDVLGNRAEGPLVASADDALPALVGADIAALLASGTTIQTLKDDAGKPVGPGDIAVLTRSNAQAVAVKDALAARNIPAVIAQQGSVFETQEASWLCAWLDAAADPGAERKARILALSPLGGWDAVELRSVLDDHPAQWLEWMQRVHDVARRLEARGFSQAYAQFMEAGEVAQRLAMRTDGDRVLTNLRHLSELIHAAEQTRRLGPAALSLWLRNASIPDASRGSEEDTQPVRLESDDDAVRITTIHKSKGLEYPITFIPNLWNGTLLKGSSKSLFMFHETKDGRSVLTLDARTVGSKALASRQAHEQLAEAEALQENLRLLYVALTRAKHRAVAYWGPTRDAATSPLGVLLHGGEDAIAAPGSRAITAATALAQQGRDVSKPVVALLSEKSAQSVPQGETPQPAVGWDETPLQQRSAWLDSHPIPSLQKPAVMLGLKDFAPDHVGSLWARSSYTSLTSHQTHAAHSPDAQEGKDLDAVAAAPEDLIHPPVLDGEETAPTLELQPPEWVDQGEEDVALSQFHRGTDAGKFIHSLLENLDFQDARERAAPKRPMLDLAADLGRGLPFLDDAQLTLLGSAFPKVLHTPLGAGAGNVSLANIPLKDRLDELGFDLPLQGGDAWSRSAGGVSGEALGALLGTPRPDGHFAPGYLEFLRQGGMGFKSLAGFLTGSMDLVYRVKVGATHRWYVCDYKTNWIGTADPVTGVKRCTRTHYTLPWLVHEMAKHHYVIQYHLYLVALHRFLRLRIPSYDYDVHIGGAVYLFLRGMDGSAVPSDGTDPPGVFVDRPPRAVIEGLDRLFDGSPL